MISTFFSLATRSPSRQRAFRRVLLGHILILSGMIILFLVTGWKTRTPLILSQALLVMGIVEGSVLIGWRLTQMPKSQSLEFLLASPLRPRWVFIDEMLVGLAKLTFVTLSGLPILMFLVGSGALFPWDLAPLLIMPLTWGAITGMILTVWAYEPRWVRRIGERIMMLLILFYLVVGVLAGEKLKSWLQQLPESIGRSLYYGLISFRESNPFGVFQKWMTDGVEEAWDIAVTVQFWAMIALILLVLRAASRLHAHFHERHYGLIGDVGKKNRGQIREQPLTWWAVRRVSEYSGRSNLWLAGGFSILYAWYIIADTSWPTWMGRNIFLFCDRAAGPAGLATALVILAAVPAAFQYGLWDASIQDRCRRLELLLLTKLSSRDYWNAAASAAWHRGRGYFIVAGFLWIAALIGNRATVGEVIAGIACSALLWGFYFTLGFRAFSHGMQANGLGMLLTVALPLLAYGCSQLGWQWLVALIPPGSVYAASSQSIVIWFPGPLFMAALTLWLARRALASCETDLRDWYDQNHGQKVMV